MSSEILWPVQKQRSGGKFLQLTGGSSHGEGDVFPILSRLGGRYGTEDFFE